MCNSETNCLTCESSSSCEIHKLSTSSPVIIKNCKECELNPDSCNTACLRREACASCGSRVYQGPLLSDGYCSDCHAYDLAAAPTIHSVPAVESWPPVSSFLSAYVLIIFTNNGKSHRYFCGFGKGKRLQSAWSLAGARLFLIDNKEQTTSGSEMVNAEFVLATKGIKFERRVVSLRSAEASK